MGGSNYGKREKTEKNSIKEFKIKKKSMANKPERKISQTKFYYGGI